MIGIRSKIGMTRDNEGQQTNVNEGGCLFDCFEKRLTVPPSKVLPGAVVMEEGKRRG
jgi:hypothetical protein